MSYYHLDITDIPIGFAGKPEMCETSDGQQLPSLPVYVCEKDLDWWIKEYGSVDERDPDTICHIAISDNGSCGDGVQLIIATDGGTEIVRTLIPDESLLTLIEALTAIQRLRASECESPDRRKP